MAFSDVILIHTQSDQELYRFPNLHKKYNKNECTTNF